MKQMEIRRTRGALVLGVALFAGACTGDSPATPTDAKQEELSTLAIVRCDGDASAGTISCGDASTSSGALSAGPRTNITLGGQGTNVRLSADASAPLINGQITISNVRVQNLIAQSLGVATGGTPTAEGVRVFFHSGPVGDNGAISVANADGLGNFTGTAQPFFRYAGGVEPGATSEPKNWTLNVPAGTGKYSFQVYVNARVPNEYFAFEQTRLANTTSTLYGFWAVSGNEFFSAGAGGALYYYNGSSWVPRAHDAGTTNLFDVWAGNGSVWAVGASGRVLRENAAGSMVTIPSGTTASLMSVRGTQYGVFAVGTGNTILRYNFDGTLVGPVNTGFAGGNNFAVFAIGSNVYVVGTSGTQGRVLKYDGTVWTQTLLGGTTNTLLGIYGKSENDIWAVGNYATMYHFDGNSWTQVAAPVPAVSANYLYGIAGSDANNMLVVGGNGTVLHYDGTSWRNVSYLSTQNNLRGVWAGNASSFWAVGSNMTVTEAFRRP